MRSACVACGAEGIHKRPARTCVSKGAHRLAVKSSRSVFLVLKRLAEQTEPLGPGELSSSLALPMTTTLRALATLEAAGYAERHQSSTRYVLGKAARTLAFAFVAQFPIRDLALPHLERLARETGVTSSLFVRLGWRSVRIAAVSRQDMIVPRTPVGEARPLTLGAASLAILSQLDEDVREAAFRHDEADGLDTRAARVDCERGRAAGEVWVDCTADPGAMDCAVPLFDARARVVASVAIEGLPKSIAANVMAPHGAARLIVKNLSTLVRAKFNAYLVEYEETLFASRK